MSLLGHSQSTARRDTSRSLLRRMREHGLLELPIARSAGCHFNAECQCMQERNGPQHP